MTDLLVESSVQGDRVAVLTLNDPARRNALSGELREQLLVAVRHEATNPDTKALVLTGAGPGFCSGGDISAMGVDPERSLRWLQTLHDTAMLLGAFPKPVVAAVNGHAFGAGLSLALLADYVITSPKAKFGATFAKMGVVPDTGFLWVAGRRIGQARTLQLVMTARTVEAEEAVAMGLMDELADDVLTTAVARAESFCQVAPLPFAAAKASFAQGLDGLAPYLAREMADMARMYRTADHLEAVAAFREKRSAKFIGA